MATTDLADVTAQVQEKWAPIFTAELRESFKLAGICDRTYDTDELAMGGDTIKVSQVNAPAGFLLDITKDNLNQACEFDTEALDTQQIEINIDKRAGAAYEFCDLVQLLSQIDPSNERIRENLRFAMNQQVNGHLYSKVAASASAPDHVLESTAALNASVLTELSKLADEAYWPEGQRWLLVDPTYHKDLLDSTTLVSSDFVSDSPVMTGMIARRFGWNIMVDNSAALKTYVGNGTSGAALAFIPEFLHCVTAREAQIKISDQHANRKFGYVMSVDMVFGAALGNDAANKHIEVRVAA